MWDVRQLRGLINIFKEDFKPQRSVFPSPKNSLEAGIIAVGVPPTVENLYEAYSYGIFPWPHEGYPLLWFSPDQRGVLDFKDFHIPERLQRELKKKKFKFTWNHSFEEVMQNCKNSERKAEAGTWITDELIRAYLKFHHQGYAHSIEVWKDEQLVGGLYGVCVGGLFSAESMYFKVSPASKAALIFCVESLKSAGHHWMDIQMVSSVSKQFGGKYISKADFLKRLKTRI